MPPTLRLRALLALAFLLAARSVANAADSPASAVVIAAIPDWQPLAGFTTDITPGGVFDFSFLNDAPAGKYGPILITADGRFEFQNRPGVRARFWGVNLVSSACFLDKETADRLVDRLARSGYNAVRLHHTDRILSVKDAASGTLDPAKLDQLDYLAAACKKRGLYLNIDLYSIRLFNAEEMVSFGLPADAAKGLTGGEAATLFRSVLPFSTPAFDAWASYARALLFHRNPYTGLTWAEDPALTGICPVNEDTAGGTVEKNPPLKDLYEREFTAWLDRDDHRAILERDGRGGAFGRFVIESHVRIDQRLLSFLRDLGVRTPLTGANHRNFQGTVYLREAYDYVDNHQYWDHPKFLPGKRFQLPFQFEQQSAVVETARTPRNIMASRILGKPFTVTEFNYVRPNRYRAEGVVVMPAYASLQDWDGLYNFNYASTLDALTTGNVSDNFALAGDPVGLLGDRLSALLFLRGDIAPATHAIVFVAEKDTAFSKRETSFGDAYTQLGLVTRVASLAGSPADLRRRPGISALVVDEHSASAAPADHIYPADANLQPLLADTGILPPGSINSERQRFRSETGQITLEAAAGTLQVVTPRSELFVLPPGATLAGETVSSVVNRTVFCSVSVVAVDGKPLAKSERLLVVHLTDAAPTGAQFAAPDRRLMETRGDLPYLIEPGAADITLRLVGAAPKAWAVQLDGTRLHPVPLEKTPGGWRLHADTAAPGGPVFAYEIVATAL